MRTKIIAEVASNHGGDMRLAKEFVAAAAGAGADYVKFQSWQAKNLKPDDAQYEWFRKSGLSDEDHFELIDACKSCGVRFLTTCFEAERVEFLATLGMDAVKVGSADTGSYRMLRALRERFDHVLVSTGMATDAEVAGAVDALKGGRFTLMHTVSLYPTPPEEARLSRMDRLRVYGGDVGYSDHTLGNDAVKLAIDRGAAYVEKHFCLGRDGPGRAMPWDMTPDDLREIVEHARAVETLLGEGDLPITPALEASRRRFIGRFGDNR